LGKEAAVNVHAITWVGIRTERWDDNVEMFERLLGLRRTHDLPGIAAFETPNGDTLEIITNDEPEHRHFTTGPVVGFRVDDVEAGRAELEAAGVDVVGPVQRGGGMAWVHFRGPDGTVWELTEEG
jgi:catechol 2,3-dioxygenase-like lactoylglutathione lyase family enzyme